MKREARDLEIFGRQEGRKVRRSLFSEFPAFPPSKSFHGFLASCFISFFLPFLLS